MEIPERKFKYFDLIMASFVAILIISNITSTKITQLGFLIFDAGTLLFPISYIFGDILTEVYGYKKARRVIWTGFFLTAVGSLYIGLVGFLPVGPGWEFQSAYEAILGFVPRIVLASLIAFFAGEFSNSYILAKMKILTKGKHLWSRTIGSTIVGQGIDTGLFALIAFYGVLPIDVLVALIVSNYVFKVGIEVLFTPVTYWVVNLLKQKENQDYYDTKTNFNPFSLSEKETQ
ncbi:MAG: queuosine precursor transporter [Candidatus Diapherotrites archaeon]|nr:queuosine precursor transporter [Candidatus Diapherotrites archaeon]